MSDLEGRAALITGAASGIGLATAKALAARGARIMVSDINIDAAAAAVDQLKAAGGEADAVRCDIGSEDEIQAAVAKTVECFGKLDIMHNNAALLSPDVLMSDVDVLSMDADIWDRVMQVNVRGTMLGCKHAVAAMLKSGSGAIINTSSMYGMNAFNRMPAYSVSKAAINMLTQHVATAYGRQNIRCNAIAPALIKTAASEAVIPKPLTQLHDDAAALPFSGTAEDMANVVVFLASDESRYITGEVLRVDGGTTSHLATYSDARRFFGD
ncbi:SDR family oxidoreductase [Sphingobium phenoxybenzoativorans]|uniref:SDR family oxidoreductase n=1 Tax=Sphingobium phenoxybenzoativorans TaxID=1592790 RepID=A0A975Q2U4_9SPHN|nr:SDR family oxidoreductase [Sphingobium phenoxybenzoativorans]QUT06822.1 SDR family oxidoreductase [Sphingobium phenoxybenzoativorans]